ncbi:MAG: hypothetical protein IJ906_08035 [Oscillospiraceae bacterium]|nr:hypothetical protein [Oscillospiraceae bacterium]
METDFWGTLRAVLNIAAPAATIAAPILIAVSVYLASRDRKCRKDDPERRPSRLPAVLVIAGIGLAILMNLLFFVVSVKYYAAREQRVAAVPSFPITSENLHDGVWDTVIGKEQGENKSPQLSWEPVEGANAYGILMIDTDAGNWLHWKTGMVTTAGIPLGYAGSDTYVGPYPPAGTTHSYTIYVAALREADANVLGFLDNRNDYADYTSDKLLCSMDVTDGGSAGNVIAVGTITGTYSTVK